MAAEITSKLDKDRKPETIINDDDRPSLQFINITNQVKISQPALVQVRSQAMLDFNWRKRQSDVPASSNECEGIGDDLTPAVKGQIHKLRLGPTGLQPWARKKRSKIKFTKARQIMEDENLDPDGRNPNFTSCDSVALFGKFSKSDESWHLYGEESDQEFYLGSALKATPLRSSPSAGSMDPFNASAILINQRTQSLIHFYFNERFRSSWLVMPVRKGLLSFGIHDEAVFHSCLSQWSTSYSGRYKSGDPFESFHHRAQGIHILNKRLGDPNNGVSDGSIVAIANIAVYEASNGSISSARVHLEGLDQMVKMRGGIQQGGFAPLVLRMLGNPDLHFVSLALGFDFQCANALPFPYNEIPNPSIDSMLQSLRYLSAFQEISDGRLEQLENFSYSDQALALQRHLMSLSYINCEALSVATNDLFERSTATAALILSYVVLRDIPFTYRILATFVSRLQNTLAGLFSESGSSWTYEEFTPHPELQKLFWALVIGGMAAEGRLEYPWFCDQFTRLRLSWGIMTWAEMKVWLQAVFWREDLNEAGQKLWNMSFFVLEP